MTDPSHGSGGLAIGVDIGGTKVAGGVVDSRGNVIRRVRRDTPHRSVSPALVEQTIVEVVEDLNDGGDHIVAVGVGAAGFVDARTGSVAFAPHLSWREEPLQAALSVRTDLPVVVENDANAALWAEWCFGVARDETHVVMVTLGTGIGGGILTESGVERGRFGMAAEFGHVQVVPGGHRCECGNRGCWEQYASGKALVREARALVANGSPMAAELRDRSGGDPARVTGPMVTDAARAGDRAARELLTETGAWLGTGLANLAAALDPGLFVVGGGLGAAGDLLLEPARAAYRRQLPGRGHRPEAAIVAAALGNEAGLVGAADLARRRVAGDPA